MHVDLEARALERMRRDDALEPGVRIGVLCFAAIVRSARDGDAALRAARRAPHRDAELIFDLCLQVPLFAGFPRAINALQAFHRELGPTSPPRQEATAAPDLTERRQRGEELFRRVYGDRSDRVLEELDRLHPELRDWIVCDAYGLVLSRPGASPATRELAAVAGLIVSGDLRQLSSHVRGALRCGAGADAVRAASAHGAWLAESVEGAEAEEIVATTIAAG